MNLFLRQDALRTFFAHIARSAKPSGHITRAGVKSMRNRIASALLFCCWAIGGSVSAAASAASAPCIWYADGHAIHQVATDTNEVTQTIALKEAHRLAMNGSDCGVWAVVDKQLVQYDANAVQTQKIALASLNKKFDDAGQLAVDPYDSSLWLADEKTLVHVAAGGQFIGSTNAPGNIRKFILGLDQSVWILGNKQLWHVSNQGALLSSQDLHKTADAAPKQLALDHLAGLLWLAGEKELTQINLNQPSHAPLHIKLPHQARAMTLNPTTGELWLATEKSLLSYGRDGAPTHTVDLQAIKFRDVDQFAFDPVTQSLWAATDKSLGRFSAQGEFVLSVPAKDG